MRIFSFCFILAFCSTAFHLSAQKFALRADSSYDVSFYHIRLDLPLDKPYLKGEVDVHFKTNEQQIKLDLYNSYKVAAVKGAKDFVLGKDGIVVTLNPEQKNSNGSYEITVVYEGEIPVLEVNGFERGLLYKQVGANKTRMIATVIEDEYAHLLFPCHNVFGDRADSIKIDVTIPDEHTIFKDEKGKEHQVPFTVVSNGVMKGSSAAEGKRTYRWHHNFPIHPKHVSIAISDFAKTTRPFSDDENGVQFPIHFYVRPTEMQDAQGMMARAPEILTCLSNTFGAYPYHQEGVSITHVGIPVGKYAVNGQSAILMENFSTIYIYKLVNALSNMWFGNHIVPEKWQDAWITEAFATYGESVWHEYKRSIRGYQMLLDQKEYFDKGKLYLDKISDYSEERLNKKGIWVIHMLRGILGEQYFYETLVGITQNKRLKKTTISTEDLQSIAEYYASENVKQNFDYFFKQWVYGESYPTFEVTFENLKKGGVNVSIAQQLNTTTPNFFQMPIRLEFTFSDGSTKVEEKVMLSGKALENLHFATNLPVTNLDFDQGARILKKLNFVRQKLDAKNPIYDFKITTSEDRREITLKGAAMKKQNVKVELIQMADMIEFMEDQIISKIEFSAPKGEFEKSFKIPLPADKRGNYLIRVTGKSDIYSYPVRLLQIVNRFE